MLQKVRRIWGTAIPNQAGTMLSTVTNSRSTPTSQDSSTTHFIYDTFGEGGLLNIADTYPLSSLFLDLAVCNYWPGDVRVNYFYAHVNETKQLRKLPSCTEKSHRSPSVGPSQLGERPHHLAIILYQALLAKYC